MQFNNIQDILKKKVEKENKQIQARYDTLCSGENPVKDPRKRTKHPVSIMLQI